MHRLEAVISKLISAAMDSWVWPGSAGGVGPRLPASMNSKEKGELRRLSVNELKGIGSLQFILYVEAGDFTGSMMGHADLEEHGHL